MARKLAAKNEDAVRGLPTLGPRRTLRSIWSLAPGTTDRVRLVRIAQALAWSSLVWMMIEGAVGLWAGIAASSIALIGFALSSVVEGLASVIVIWRFWGTRALSEDAEGRAQKAVAISFWLLAPYLAFEAVEKLVRGSAPEVSVVGIALAAIAVVLMPLFGVAKRRVGSRLNSAATAGEGTQNLLCAYLSLAVLGGLAANAVLGWWWADPGAALFIAAVAVKEGVESWRGEGCCDHC
jgi:divalent metal cation (Fe/Co/Zn/Cd) transporter